jgi:hypothetical protein
MQAYLRAGLLSLTVAAIASGCVATTPGALPRNSLDLTAPDRSQALKTPALVTLNLQFGDLEYWPIRQGGGNQPKELSPSLGVFSAFGLAADGNVVAVANYSPAEIVTYNVATKATAVLPDAFGKPIDIAVGKGGTLYALNLNTVTVYPPGSSQPSELNCSAISDGVAIGVDNEGDVFVNGYGTKSPGVFEFAAGSQTCSKVPIRPEFGYVGGVGVDPKTDDLIVVDNPDLCAGGLEGRMLVYPKPYGHVLAHRKILNPTYCAGTFRLNADSTKIFVSDSTVSAGFPLIDQRSYPGALHEGTYQDDGSGQDLFGGFTTIPNTLPN